VVIAGCTVSGTNEY